MFWLEKDIAKVEILLLQWLSQNILENQTSQRIAKFIMAIFYEMDFMKGIAISVKKKKKIYNILKSASHCLLVERWNGSGWWYAHTFTTSLL